MECRARAHYLKLLFQSLSSQPTNKNIELKLTLHRKLKHYHVSKCFHSHVQKIMKQKEVLFTGRGMMLVQSRNFLGQDR